MNVYSWPVSLLREIERWIKNFIWSGDIYKKKMVIVAWKKICSDLDEGGLGLRSLVCLNEASNLKSCWDLVHSEEQWAFVLRSRVIRDSYSIQHHVFSSIWSGIKNEYQTIIDNSIWLVGDGENINCWIDNWCGEVLAHSLNLSSSQLQSLPNKLCNFVRSNQWYFPAGMFDTNPNLYSLVNQVTIPTVRRRDKLVWKHSNNGEITLKEAYCFKKSRAPKLPWAMIIWSADFPPSKSLLVWRFMHGKLPTDENLAARGCQLPSMCSLCCNALETSNHLFLECSYALHLWSWFASTVN